MTDEFESDDQEDFELWKAAVGLPRTFPQLQPIPNSDLTVDRLFYAGPKQAEKVDEILKRAGGTLVYVRLTPGHGCTTLSRFIFLRLVETALSRRLIPVRLALDEVSPQRLLTNPLDVVQEAMRRDIISSLASETWHYVLGSAEYAEIIGAQSGEPKSWELTKNLLRSVVTDRDEKLQQDRRGWDSSALAAVTKAAGETDAPVPDARYDRAEEGFFNLSKLATLSPELARPIDDVLARLSTDFRVRVSLQVDLSSPQAYDEPDLYRRMIAALQRGLKALHQRDQQKKLPTYPTVLNEMYFGHMMAYETLEYGWMRPAEVVEYPWYRPLDVFAILSRYHYPQKAGAIAQNSQEALASVMDQELLEEYIGEEWRISKTVEALTTTLRAAAKQGVYQLRSSRNKQSAQDAKLTGEKDGRA